MIAPAVELPRLVVGDIVVLHEAGGNTLSLGTSHCSRRRPPVYGYSRDTSGEQKLPDAWSVDDGLRFTCLSPGTRIEQVLEMWAD